jgi:thymidylate synthase
MGDIIILEGCDKTGKSTLAHALGEKLGWRVVASGPPTTNWPAAEYADVLTDPEPLILDRFHLGELVYGPLYRQSNTSPLQLGLVETLLNARGAFLVLLEDTVAAIQRRFHTEHETFALAADIPAILAKFRQVYEWSMVAKIRATLDVDNLEAQVSRIATMATQTIARPLPVGAPRETRLVAPNGAVLYRTLLEMVLAGMPSRPRGLPTREVLLTCASLEDPRQSVIATPARKLNQRFASAEFCWIMAGEQTADGIEDYNKAMATFADQGADGRTFFGAYGPPVMLQMSYLVELLHRDPESRQAVMTIWRPNPPATKDVPCTVACQYLLRGGRLEAITYMRSNDLWLGFPYDLQTFTRLQGFLASRLGVELGMYHHIVGSLHLYESNRAAAAAVVRATPVPGPAIKPFAPIASTATVWHDRQSGRHLERADEWGVLARAIQR